MFESIKKQFSNDPENRNSTIKWLTDRSSKATEKQVATKYHIDHYNRFFLLEPSELNNFCDKFKVKYSTLHVMTIKGISDFDIGFKHYFSSSLDMPLPATLLPLLTPLKKELSVGDHFIIVVSDNDSCEIGVIRDACIMSIPMDIPLKYDSVDRATEALKVLAELKSIRDYKVHHLDLEELKKKVNTGSYYVSALRSRWVGKLKYGVVFISLLIVFFYAGWSLR